MPSYGDRFRERDRKRQEEEAARERAEQARSDAAAREWERSVREGEKRRGQIRQQILGTTMKYYDADIKELLQAYVEKNYDYQAHPPLKPVEGPTYDANFPGGDTVATCWYVYDVQNRPVIEVVLLFHKGLLRGWHPYTFRIRGTSRLPGGYPNAGLRFTEPSVSALFADLADSVLDYTFTVGHRYEPSAETTTRDGPS